MKRGKEDQGGIVVVHYKMVVWHKFFLVMIREVFTQPDRL